MSSHMSVCQHLKQGTEAGASFYYWRLCKECFMSLGIQLHYTISNVFYIFYHTYFTRPLTIEKSSIAPERRWLILQWILVDSLTKDEINGFATLFHDKTFSLTCFKFPDISRFSRQVITLLTVWVECLACLYCSVTQFNSSMTSTTQPNPILDNAVLYALS